MRRCLRGSELRFNPRPSNWPFLSCLHGSESRVSVVWDADGYRMQITDSCSDWQIQLIVIWLRLSRPTRLAAPSASTQYRGNLLFKLAAAQHKPPVGSVSDRRQHGLRKAVSEEVTVSRTPVLI